MKKRPFNFPMKKYESTLGILFIPVHAYVWPMVLSLAVYAFGASLSDAALNLIYYAVSTLFMLLALNQYWRATIRDFTGAPIRAIQAIILGGVAYFVIDYAVALLMSQFMQNLVNPNSAAVYDIMELDPNTMLVVTVLLAPIAEETMFRGALFGTIRKRSRLLAYVVSALVFAVYHLWEYAVYGSGVSVLIYGLQYIPASLALAWCYEYSGSLVAPVIMHALINLISTVDIVWR